MIKLDIKKAIEEKKENSISSIDDMIAQNIMEISDYKGAAFCDPLFAANVAAGFGRMDEYFAAMGDEAVK